MSVERFARIEALFHEALQLPAAQRASFLHDHEVDAGVRDAVLRLLEHAHGETIDPLTERLAAAIEQLPALTIGDYRLLRELGAGGMGTVFLAERDVEGRPQQVAIKLLRGLPTEAGKRRMARERGMLAGLNHPQIAGHIDGGETQDGQPYLVMDYVEGLPLPEYLAAAAPTLPARLQLFLRLCDAVQHAHQRLILHRDIKPSNVLVRADGSPVLLDFGVGKLLEDTDAAHTVTLAFTPAYGAPEQYRGQLATTATDVFGLGALLFDLLTDQRLATLRSAAAAVPPASSVVAEIGRKRALRGDLDRIVHKATHEEPEQRYRTVAALADDVQRYLRGEPIAAAPDVFWYRLRKFVARHRLPVAAAAVFFVLGSVFVWRLDIERQRALVAERQARAAKRTADQEAASAKASRDFLASVLAETSPDAVRGRPITLSALLQNASRKLQADTTQDASARAIAWLTIAEVYDRINDPRRGLQAADAALALLRSHAVGTTELLARALQVRGLMLTQLERSDEARAAIQQAIAIRRRSGADAPTLARAYADYATVAMHAGDFDVAERHQLLALRVLAHEAGSPALRVEILLGLAATRYYRNDIDGAAAYLDRAQTEARRTLAADDPVMYRLHRVASLVRQSQDRSGQALRHAQTALGLAYRVYGRQSRSTAETEFYMALLLDDCGRPREAVAHYLRGRAIAHELGLSDAMLATYDASLAMAYLAIAEPVRARDRADAALAGLPDQPAYVPWSIKALWTRALAHAAVGQTARANADFDHAERLARAHGADAFVGVPAVQLRRAQALLDEQRFGPAAVSLEAATALMQQDLDVGAAIQFRHLRAALALEQGDLVAATRWLTQAQKLAAARLPADALPLAGLDVLAARLALRDGDTSRARELLDAAAPVLQRELAPEAPLLKQWGQLRRDLGQ